ncbi:hypothetical protein BKA70DRAFT_1573837 [Coprinopsis sp. MPI-PUGE-AT-0042]|nr:hypothetical protein BKA70DRAFT_1573837 [Coprinopsis sp. MPI-PUGE-AT-0042]
MNSKVLLPNEILLEIFHQSLPRRVDQQGRLVFQTIRSVCSRWRAVSLSSPALWSSVAVESGISDKGYHGKYVALLDGWFSRAGPCLPLELEYVERRASSMRNDEKAAMEALILRHQSRWRWLSLFIEPQCFWRTLFNPPPSNWTNLSTLALWTFDFSGPNKERAALGFNMLERFTSLRSLSLEVHHGYGFKRRFGPINLGEIRITLEDHFGIQEIRLISAYSNLTNIVLIAPANCEWNLSPHDNLTLPSLSTFVFDTFDLSLLDHLVTPSLVNLDIHLHWDVPWPQSGFLHGFLARCTTTLRSVTLNSDREDSFIAKILPSLSLRPTLSHLTLDIWPSHVDTKPIPEEVEKDWCPQLRCLTVSIGSSDMVELERMKGLAAFLLRRGAFGLPELERLTVHRTHRAVEFPYEIFENVRQGELCVLVPW